MSEETPTRYTGRALKAKEVAAILRVHEHTVKQWIRQGILDASTVPGPGGCPSYELVDKLLKSDATPRDNA